jgi:hypothetical protein
MAATRTRTTALYVVPPFIRTLKLLIAPVPDPATQPLARSYNDKVTLMRMHPGLSADEIVYAAIPYLTREEFRQWMVAFDVWAPVDLIYANPWLYLSHLRHLRAEPSAIPLPLRIN